MAGDQIVCTAGIPDKMESVQRVLIMRTILLAAILDAGSWAAVRLPVSFEPNRHQESGDADYLVRERGFTLFLNAGRVEIRSHRSRTSMVLPGARQARAEAEAPLPGVVNYLKGPDASHYITGIPTYRRVRYRGVYAGVDVVYHGEEGSVEYDFVVAPGADPRRIRLRFEGTRGEHLDRAGDLVIETAAGRLRQHRPVVYQQIAGVRREVSCRHMLRGGEVRFQIGPYDRTRPLVIDPAITWATYYGGATADSAQGLAVDASGNIVVTGYLVSSRGDYDVFVSKISADGTTEIYRVVYGGSGDDAAYGVAVDAAGNAYFAGQTDSPDLPQYGYLNAYPGQSVDGFVAKVDPAGKTLLYSNYLGGAGDDIIFGLALDSANNAYVTGATNSSNFPTSSGTAQPAYAGGIDVFVTKFDSTGKAIYSTYLGGAGDDYGNGIAVDAAGDAFVTGSTTSTNFPVTSPVFQGKNAGSTDAYVSKLSPAGTLLFSTYLGGSGNDIAEAIAVDSSGAAYVTGKTTSQDFPVASAVQGKSGGGAGDIFISKLNAEGGSLAYSTYLGGTGDDSGSSIAVDGAGNAYITGTTTSGDFPLSDAFQQTNQGTTNGVVAALNASGSALLFSSYLGGNGSSGKNGDAGNAISVSCSDGLVVAGDTSSPNFPATPGALRTSYQGGTSDAFIARIAAGGGTPAIAAGGVVNAATSAAGRLAAGSLATVYGSGLAVATLNVATPPWSTNVAGTSVSINGTPAPISFASSGQINVQIPYEIGAGPAVATIATPCGTTPPASFQVAQAAPYIFQTGGGAAIAQNQDGTINGPSNPAPAGTVITVYLTGIGPLDNPVPTGQPAPTNVLSRATLSYSGNLGGLTASLQFLGLTPQFIGLAQANVIVPPLSIGTYPIVITIGGVNSNGALVYVK